MITSILSTTHSTTGTKLFSNISVSQFNITTCTYLSTFKVTGKGEKKVVCGKGSEDEIGSWMISWCSEIKKKCKDKFHSIFLKSYH